MVNECYKLTVCERKCLKRTCSSLYSLVKFQRLFLTIDFLLNILTIEILSFLIDFKQEEWQLKDRFKPLYYAILYFLRDEFPTEYLRMGPELKETVDDILAEVAQMAIDYA